MKREGPPLARRAGNTTTAIHTPLSHTYGPQASPKSSAAEPLAALRQRAQALAARVTAGQLSFIDAVDRAYDTGVALGLRDDDVIQAVRSAIVGLIVPDEVEVVFVVEVVVDARRLEFAIVDRLGVGCVAVAVIVVGGRPRRQAGGGR